MNLPIYLKWLKIRWRISSGKSSLAMMTERGIMVPIVQRKSRKNPNIVNLK